MSSYFKTKIGTERGKSNGFIAGIMRCKSRMQIYQWFAAHDKQFILDDIAYFRDSRDLSLEENATVKKIIDKLEAMMG